MADSSTILDAVNPRGVGVRISLQRMGDRFAHTIYGVRHDTIDPIIASVEDADYEGWPLSPPLQELRESTDAEGNRALLLLGSAAYGHWSVSISSKFVHVRSPCIEIDLAVRLHRAPAYLGTAYELVGNGNWIDHVFTVAKRDPHRLLITASPEDVTGTVTPSDLLKAFPGEAPSRRLFLPARQLPQHYPGSYRWRYIIAAAV